MILSLLCYNLNIISVLFSSIPIYMYNGFFLQIAVKKWAYGWDDNKQHRAHAVVFIITTTTRSTHLKMSELLLIWTL